MKKSNWLLLIKIALTIVSLWFIYKQVIEKENFSDVIRDAKHLAEDSDAIYLLITSLFLMLINWSIEAVKWKFLTGKIININFFKALNAVLSGVTVSIFSPNRMGEFAGRILHLPAEIRVKATFATIIGNTSQFAITLFSGSIAAGFILQYIEIELQVYFLIAGSLIILNLVLLYLYFNFSFIDKFLMRFEFLHKFKTHINAFSAYSKTDLTKILLFSFARYLVFSTQYVLILKMMNIDAAWLDLYFAVAAVFLAITVIPSIALTELAIRTSVAVAVIGLVSENNLGILEASFMVWFINLVIPSVFGSFTLLTLKLSKQK